jgi:hypothetical protein
MRAVSSLTMSAATPGHWRSIATETSFRRWLTGLFSRHAHFFFNFSTSSCAAALVRKSSL